MKPNKVTIRKIVDAMKTTDLLPMSAKLKRCDRSHAVLLATNYGGDKFKKVTRNMMAEKEVPVILPL